MKKFICLLLITLVAPCYAPSLKRPSCLDICLKLTPEQQKKYDSFFSRTTTNLSALIDEQRIFSHDCVKKNLQASAKKGLTLSAYIRECWEAHYKKQYVYHAPHRLFRTIHE